MQLNLNFSAPPKRLDCRVAEAAGAQVQLAASVPETLQERLAPLLDFEVERLIFTNNRSTFLSCSPLVPSRGEEPGARWILRVHRAFERADALVLHSLATFLNRRSKRPQRQRALAILRTHFAQGEGSSEVSPPPRPPRLRPRGEAYDLIEVLTTVRRHAVFAPLASEPVAITWGRQRQRRSQRGAPQRQQRQQRSVQLGSYVEGQQLIRVHPVLDQPVVPKHVVESVVFHELVHAIVPPERRGRRRVVHSSEFRCLERLDPHYESSEEWIKQHIFRLLAA